MPEETTPGQVCYEAYTRLSTPDRPWAQLHPNQRGAWEAAALAVRAREGCREEADDVHRPQ